MLAIKQIARLQNIMALPTATATPKVTSPAQFLEKNQSYKPTITTMSLLLNRTTRMNDLTQWQSLCQGAFSRATL
jgi:hypothetical protein